jgi:16S rRNA U1498 N3-methylase RsmE
MTRIIDFLYDDLENKHSEIEALEEALKQANEQCRRNIAAAEDAIKELTDLKKRSCK